MICYPSKKVVVLKEAPAHCVFKKPQLQVIIFSVTCISSTISNKNDRKHLNETPWYSETSLHLS